MAAVEETQEKPAEDDGTFGDSIARSSSSSDRLKAGRQQTPSKITWPSEKIVISPAAVVSDHVDGVDGVDESNNIDGIKSKAKNANKPSTSIKAKVILYLWVKSSCLHVLYGG